MTFKDLQETFKNEFGITKLADIARELNVTPQVVSNWKSKNQMPYKYVKKLNKKVLKKNNSENIRIEKPITLISSGPIQNENDEADDLNIFHLINRFYVLSRNNIYLIIFIPIVISFLAAFYVTYYVSNKYETEFKIIPTGSNQPSLPQGLAGVAGLSGIGQADLKSGRYFPEIINSRKMLEMLLNKRFEVQKVGKHKKTLLSIILSDDKDASIQNTDAAKVAKALKKLKNSLKIKTKKAKIITEIYVSSSDPKLSYDLGIELIKTLNEILRKFEQDRIKLKKEFILNRIVEEKTNLEAMEDKLKDFREKNREIINSPALRLEESRLKREVNVKTQIFITLKKQFEMTQINSLENSSFVHIVDSTGIPIKRKSPERTKFVIAWYIIGLLITYGSLLLIDNLSAIKQAIKKGQ